MEKKSEKIKKTKKIKTKKFSLFGAGKEKDFVIENLGMMLGSGIGVADSLGVVASGVKSHQLKKILLYMQTQIDEGSPLWKAFGCSPLLPENMIFLVRIGESSGRLPENLKIIAEQQRKERSFRSKVSSAMIYPSIVFGLTVFIGLGVAFFVLPKLSSVFAGMRIKLPAITLFLINAGAYFQANTQVILLGVAGFSVFLALLLAIPFTKKFLRDMLFHIPKIKDLMKEIEIARFGYIFGTLLSAGLPIVEAASSVIESTQSSKYKKFYGRLRDLIEEGDSIEKALADIKHSRNLLPAHIQQMVFAGERSGKLSDVLLKIDEIYEERIDISTKNLATVLEPILLIIVWFGVLAIALAVILPIYGLIGSLN